MNYLSFFSGALGFDIGFESAGFTPLLYCEANKHCINTIKANRPYVPLIEDINKYTSEDIQNIIGHKKIDLIIGGPPCQAFSTAGRMQSFNDDRGNVFLNFLDIAIKLNPEYIVIENVRGLLSAVDPTAKNLIKGGALKKIIFILESNGYLVSSNLYNFAYFGVPQVRERMVLIASKKGRVPYLFPTHHPDNLYGLKDLVTLREAIQNIENNDKCSKFPEKRLKFYRLLKEGQNWKNLPEDLQKEALGKAFFLGGGKTGFLRRLSWDKPSPTLVTSPTMPATDLAHPTEDRPLSVAEYARIQQFPDNWIFCGSIIEQYKQIGNAVPCHIGKVIAKTLTYHENGVTLVPPGRFKFSRYNNTSDDYFR